jgi:hypothetical protein
MGEDKTRFWVSKRSWRRGVVREVWWLIPIGMVLFVELLLELRGLIYGPVGVQQSRGSGPIGFS